MRELKEYIRRVPPEHRKPNFIAWLEKSVGLILSIQASVYALDNAFDLESAVGKQLDILGEIEGRFRLLDFEPSDGSSGLLDDETYRLCLKAKTGINMWDGQLPSVYETWNNLFPQYDLFIHDNQDMSMDVIVTGRMTPLLKELAEHFYIAPKPEGVRINLFFDIRYILDPAMAYVGTAEDHWIWGTAFLAQTFEYTFSKQLSACAVSDMTKFITAHEPSVR